MVHCTIAAIEWKNGEEGGWVGSGWVGSGERRSLLDSTQASLFLFGSAVTIVPFTVHFVLQYERLEQAMLSLNKLSKNNNNNNNKPVMQNKSHHYRYFLRVSSGTTYYEKGIESLTKWMQSPVVYITTLIVTTLMFCNQIMIQQKRLTYLNSL